MLIRPRVYLSPLPHQNSSVPKSICLTPTQRKRLTSGVRKLRLVPILVETDLDTVGSESSLQLARDASITHVIVATYPLHQSKRVKFEFGLAPISELASLVPLGRRSRANQHKLRLDGSALVVLDARRPFPIDEDTMWALHQRQDAWWRCRQDLTFFEASRPLWQTFGHKQYDDDEGDCLLDFFDIDLTTVGGSYQGHWGPLHGYKGPFPFTACFQIQRGRQIRWVLSVIDQVEDWYVGIAEDITPQLAALERQIRFYLPEPQRARLVGNRPHSQAGVFLHVPSPRDTSPTQLGAAE